jgi:hypothetical protein
MPARSLFVAATVLFGALPASAAAPPAKAPLTLAQDMRSLQGRWRTGPGKGHVEVVFDRQTLLISVPTEGKALQSTVRGIELVEMDDRRHIAHRWLSRRALLLEYQLEGDRLMLWPHPRRPGSRPSLVLRRVKN